MLPNFYTPVRRRLTNYEIVTLCTMTNIQARLFDFNAESTIRNFCTSNHCPFYVPGICRVFGSVPI